MRKRYTATLLFCFILAQAIGQSPRKVSVYLSGQYNVSTYTGTFKNNASGPGLGIQAFMNTKSKFKPMLDFTGDLFMDKNTVYYLQNEGKEYVDGVIVTLFAGGSFHPTESIFLAASLGPGIINDRILLGTKASFGVYLSKNKRWMGKLSGIHIFDQEPITKGDFGAVSLALAVRLF